MEKEVMSSNERLIMIKEKETEFLNKLYAAILSAKEVILDETIAKTSEIILTNNQSSRFALGLQGIRYLLEKLDAEEKLQEIESTITGIETDLEGCKSPVDYLKSINKKNRNLADYFQKKGMIKVAEITNVFMAENRDIFSLNALKAQLELEEKEETEKAEKVIAAYKKLEQKPICKEQEVVKPVSQQQLMSDRINFRYNDLCDIQRDLPDTYNTRENVERFTTRLNNLAKNYRFPMDANRSLGSYRQAENDLEKVYEEVDKIKNITTRNYISGNVIYQQ